MNNLVSSLVASFNGFRSAIANKFNELLSQLEAHRNNKSNPHGVTKAQVGLGRVDNTNDTEKPVSTAQQAALDLKVNISAIVNNLTTNAANRPLSAAQGVAIKQMIDNINTVLSSDDTTLDELQEVVDYIKANRSTLDALSISNIAGLSSALNNKVDKVSGMGLSTNDFTTAEKNKLANLSKSDVGLGSVQNYGVASQAQAEAGSANNLYVTPLRAAQLVDVRVGTATQNALNAKYGSNDDMILGAGSRVKNLANANKRPAWMSEKITLSSNTTLGTAHIGNIVEITGRDFTMANIAAAVGVPMLVITRASSGRIVQGSGTTVTWLQGGSTVNGTRTIQPGSAVTIIPEEGGVFLIAGAGIE